MTFPGTEVFLQSFFSRNCFMLRTAQTQGSQDAKP